MSQVSQQLPARRAGVRLGLAAGTCQIVEEGYDMDPMGRRRLTPGKMLRPKRMRRAARNALIFYLASKPLRRPINSRRAKLRRKYAPPRALRVLGWLLGARHPL